MAEKLTALKKRIHDFRVANTLMSFNLWPHQCMTVRKSSSSKKVARSKSWISEVEQRTDFQ